MGRTGSAVGICCAVCWRLGTVRNCQKSDCVSTSVVLIIRTKRNLRKKLIIKFKSRNDCDNLVRVGSWGEYWGNVCEHWVRLGYWEEYIGNVCNYWVRIGCWGEYWGNICNYWVRIGCWGEYWGNVCNSCVRIGCWEEYWGNVIIGWE